MPNVKKGAGRPAAAARTAKAAQTELPPIASEKIDQYAKTHHLSPEATAAAEVSPGAESPIVIDGMELRGQQRRYGVMIVAELRTVAKGLGVNGYSRMKRGELLNAILEWERAAVTVADRPVTFPEPSPVDVALDEALPTVEQILSTPPKMVGDLPTHVGWESLKKAKSYSKAQAFIDAANALEWGAAPTQADAETDRIMVVARRGDHEVIEIEWLGGVFQGDTCYYSHSGRSAIKLRNASHAKKVMAIPPATADQEAAKVSAHKLTRPSRKSVAEATTARRKALPFDPETATDEQVLEFVAHGSVLTWTNEISGEIESARVSRPSPSGRVGIKHGTSGRSVNFLGETGFRSVRVSSIVSVR